MNTGFKSDKKICIETSQAYKIALFYNIINPDTKPTHKHLTKLAGEYTSILNYWIDNYLEGKKQNTPKYTKIIIGYLLSENNTSTNRFEWAFNWVPAGKMRDDLVKYYRSVGRPNKKLKPITHYETMITRLQELCNVGIVQKNSEIKGEYRISPNIFRQTVIPSKKLKTKEKKDLLEKYNKLDKNKLTPELITVESELKEASRAEVSPESYRSKLYRTEAALQEWQNEYSKLRWQYNELAHKWEILIRLVKDATGKPDIEDKINITADNERNEFYKNTITKQPSNKPDMEAVEAGIQKLKKQVEAKPNLDDKVKIIYSKLKPGRIYKLDSKQISELRQKIREDPIGFIDNNKSSFAYGGKTPREGYGEYEIERRPTDEIDNILLKR